MSAPRLHAILDRQIRGDHALLELAQVRFRAAGLGAELSPGTPDELAELLRYRPGDDPVTVHLPRPLRVLEPASRDAICAFAARAPGQVYGLVVHDQPETETRPEEYVAAVRDLDARL